MKHLADRFNADHKEENQIIVGWKFADSHMNFKSIKRGTESGETCDLYITYEPLKEWELKKQLLLHEVIRLFNDEFPLIGPCSNPANLSPHADPIDNVGKIILYALSLEDREQKVYYSRWNHSAMGLKDQHLWCKAADRLAKKIIKVGCIDCVVSNASEKLKGDIQKLLDNDTAHYKEVKKQVGDQILKEFTDHHVQKPTERVFPAGAISATMEEGLYGITDGALILQHSIKDYKGVIDSEIKACKIYNHADKGSVDHVLTNPAQLLVPAAFGRLPDHSPQQKFLVWLKSEQGHKAISEFKINGVNSKRNQPYNGMVSQVSLPMALESNRETNTYMARVGIID
ncbi:MAG: hypothetical protein AAGG81_01315, partial [Chlamydiota bacterium]